MSRVLLHKLTDSQLVKKFPTFYGTRRFITAFTSSGVPRGVGGLGCSNPPPQKKSEDIGGVLDGMSKKNRSLDFLLQFTVFSYGSNLLNKGFF